MSNAFKPGPIEGLLQYVNRDVKPYHTKVIEVLVEYVVTDAVVASINEAMDLEIQLGQGNLTSSFKVSIDSIDTTDQVNDTIVLKATTGVPSDYLDISANFVPGMSIDIGESYHGFETAPNTFVISGSSAGSNYYTVVGDQTFFFPQGKQITAQGMVNNNGFATVLFSVYESGSNSTRIIVDKDLSGAYTPATGKVPTITTMPGNSGRYTIKSIELDHTNFAVNLVLESSLPYAVMQPAVDGSSFIRSGDVGYVCLDIIQYKYPLRAGSSLPRRVFPCASAYGSVYDLVTPDGVVGAGFDDEGNDGDNGFDPGTFSTDVSADPFAPYVIIGADEVINCFVLQGDVKAFFPYSRQFKVQGSAANNGLYNVLLSSLNNEGNTVVYVIEDIRFPYQPTGGTDGTIVTPGFYNGEYMYGFGFDQPRLCSSVPEMHAAVAFAEQLVILVTDSAAPQERGWDIQPWEFNTWDTNIEGESVNVSPSTGYDPLAGWDSGYDV